MEDKKIIPQESMAIITAMIHESKRRVSMPDLRISLMWAVLTITTAITVFTLLMLFHSTWANILWFAIPVIGIPANLIMARKARHGRHVKTFVDKISDGLWKIVGLIGIALTVVCMIFNICGYPQAWLIMFYYAFIVVGFGAAMTGVIVKESSYILGGVFSIIAGFVVVGVSLCAIPLLVLWVIPLYIVCFLLMFIVPAFVIARKLKKETR